MEEWSFTNGRQLLSHQRAVQLSPEHRVLVWKNCKSLLPVTTTELFKLFELTVHVVRSLFMIFFRLSFPENNIFLLGLVFFFFSSMSTWSPHFKEGKKSLIWCFEADLSKWISVPIGLGGSEQKKRGGGRNVDSVRTARSASVQQYKWRSNLPRIWPHLRVL